MEEGAEGREARRRVEGVIEAPTAPPSERDSARAAPALLGWGALGVLAALVHNRMWATPNLAFFSTIAENLGSNPFEGTPIEGDYLLSNVLGVAIARAVGQTSPHEYARLHLVLFALGVAAVVAATLRRFGYPTARALVALCAFAPGTTVVMQWLGQPDALTFPLAMGIAVARRAPTRVALGFLLGLSHSEQGVAAAIVAGFAAIAIDAFSTVADESDTDVGSSWSRTVPVAVTGAGWPLLGVVTGRLAIEVWFRLRDVTVHTPRTSFLDLGVDGFVDHHLIPGVWLAWSLWGPLWIVAIAGAAWALRSESSSVRRLGAAALGLGALAGVVPMLITLDQTRVYSMVTAPLLVAGAVGLASAFPGTLPGGPRRAVAAIGALAFTIVPGMFCAGEAYFATDLDAGTFVRWLGDGELPDGVDVTSFLMAPFGFEPPEI